MPRSVYYHLILSPPVEHRDTILSDTFHSSLSTLLRKHSDKFAIAFEKGSNVEFTHLDIFVEFIKPQDKSDIVRKLSKLNTDCDWKDTRFFTCKNIKTKPADDLIGYTMKEQELDNDDSKYELYNITLETVEKKVMVYKEKLELKESQKKHRPIGIQKLIMAISAEICLYTQGKNGQKWQYSDSAFTDIIILIENKGNFINLTKTQKENIRKYFRRYYASDDFAKFIPSEIIEEYRVEGENPADFTEHVYQASLQHDLDKVAFLPDSDSEF